MSRTGAVLALDVGTSSCRASLYDTRGRALRGRIAHISYSPSVTPDGGAELDPEWLMDQLGRAIDEVLHQEAHTPEILAVATTTFWHSLIGLDVHDKPLTPIYPWLDARSRAQAAALRGQLDERAVHARTGCVLHWSYWPAKLCWLRETQPGQFKRVKRWVSFGEFLQARLTGQMGASASMASGTGLLNTHTCTWDAPLLEALDIEADQLPPIVPLTNTTTLHGSEAGRWPSLADVPWLPAIGDGACSNLGAGCTTPRHTAVMVGTSGAERVIWAPPGRFTIPWGTWCYRVDERRVVIGGALNDGGSLLNWLRSALQLPALRTAEAQVGRLAPDGHGLTVLPFWGGERSTGWADDARGAIVGLRLHTQPVDILRASMEAVALRFGEVDRLLQQAMPGSSEVVATGGALLHSPAWMQILADVLGRPVLASSEPEASSRGASLLALETLGYLEKPLDALQPAARKQLRPNPGHTEIYRRAAERQRRLYDALVT